MSESPISTDNLVGIEVSKSTFRAVRVQNDGIVLDNLKTSIVDGQEVFVQLNNFIGELKNRFGHFEKLGIAIPGLLHEQTKKITYSTYIPEHEKVDFLGDLETANQIKITVENDANAAAYSEFLFGAGRRSRNLFYITLGIGIGGALIFDGKIWRGASGFAGEFGQIAVNSDGMKLEDVASASNIVRRTRSRFHQDSTSSLNKFDEEEIRLADVIGAAQKDDDFAQLMLKRTGTYVGTAIASVINLLNIEKIVIGGKIMQAGNIVLDAIVSRAKELSFAPSFDATEIVTIELGENAAAIGAALLASQSVS